MINNETTWHLTRCWGDHTRLLGSHIGVVHTKVSYITLRVTATWYQEAKYVLLHQSLANTRWLDLVFWYLTFVVITNPSNLCQVHYTCRMQNQLVTVGFNSVSVIIIGPFVLSVPHASGWADSRDFLNSRLAKSLVQPGHFRFNE